MNKLIKGVGITIGLAAWCGAWYGTGLVILNKLFPKDTK